MRKIRDQFKRGILSRYEVHIAIAREFFYRNDVVRAQRHIHYAQETR